MFAIIIGKSMQNMAQHARQHIAPVSLRTTPGPTSWESIVNGFNENFILPLGGGKLGELFGSDLPIATLQFVDKLTGSSRRSS